MKCPECGAWTRVLDTRETPDGTRRRHECANLHRFTTVESVVELRRGRKPVQIEQEAK